MKFPNCYRILGVPKYCDDQERIYAAYMKKMEQFNSRSTEGTNFVMYPVDLYFDIWYYNLAYLILSDLYGMKYEYDYYVRRHASNAKDWIWGIFVFLFILIIFVFTICSTYILYS